MEEPLLIITVLSLDIFECSECKVHPQEIEIPGEGLFVRCPECGYRRGSSYILSIVGDIKAGRRDTRPVARFNLCVTDPDLFPRQVLETEMKLHKTIFKAQLPR